MPLASLGLLWCFTVLNFTIVFGNCTCKQPDFKAYGYHACGANELRVPTRIGLLYYNSTDLGSSCKAWDLGWTPGCENPTTAPQRCKRVWCYVDPSTCLNQASYITEWFSPMDLRFSYQACGDQAAQTAYLRDTSRFLQGRTLRFAYPMEMRPWHYKVQGKWTGIMHRFFENVQARAGFVISERNVSNMSRSMFPSKWDACIHDVMMGFIDICPSVAWETDSRWNMASFTPPVLPSPLRLMVKEVPKADPWDPMSGYDSVYFSFMKPFSPGLWVVVLGLSCVASTIIRCVDSPPEERARMAEVARSGMSGSPIEWSETDSCANTCNRWCRHQSSLFTRDVLASWSGLFHGGEIVVTRTARAHLVSFAFIVLATIVISSYTANLANTLVVQASTHKGITGFGDCDPPKPGVCQKVCVSVQLERLTSELHPTMKLITPHSSAATLNALADGECDAAIIPEHDVRARSDFQEAFCDGGFTLVGQPMADMMVGIPLSDAIVNSYSLYVMHLIYENNFNELFDKFRYKAVSPDETGKLACGKNDAPSENNDDQSFKIQDLLGVFILFFIVSCLAVCCRIFACNGRTPRDPEQCHRKVVCCHGMASIGVGDRALDETKMHVDVSQTRSPSCRIFACDGRTPRDPEQCHRNDMCSHGMASMGAGDRALDEAKMHVDVSQTRSPSNINFAELPVLIDL